MLKKKNRISIVQIASCLKIVEVNNWFELHQTSKNKVATTVNEYGEQKKNESLSQIKTHETFCFLIGIQINGSLVRYSFFSFLSFWYRT